MIGFLISCAYFEPLQVPAMTFIGTKTMQFVKGSESVYYDELLNTGDNPYNPFTYDTK